MSQVLQEFVNSARERLRVDRTIGVIRGVKLLGLRSRNGRRYREDALREAVALYEGAKVNVNHPKGHPLSPRDYQDRLGVVRAVRFRIGDGLFGDLHFNPKHPLSEQLVWDAEHAPQNVGMSHNVLARTTTSGAETIVEAITKVQSIDLVADPATTAGLFEHVEPEDATRGRPRFNLPADRAGTTYAGLPGPAGARDQGPESARLARRGRDRVSYDALTLEELRLHRPDLVDEVEHGWQAELAEVSGQLEQAQARVAVVQRRERIVELLREHELPLPSSHDIVDSWLVGPRFMESLMRAADDEAVRELIVERAELMRSAHTWSENHARIGRRPRSRDQLSVAQRGSGRVASAAEFAAALRGR